MDSVELELIAAGNQDAFKSMFVAYFPKINFFISHLIKIDAVAEELSQDIFVKLWVERERLTTIRSLKAYLYRMARNSALNYLEHRKIEQNYESRCPKNNDFSIEEEFYAREIELLVLLTVSKMPTQRKTVYEMSRHENLKNEEIALKLDISKKTVENHLNLALKEIRKSINLAISLFF